MSHRLLPSAVGVVAAILVSGLLAVAAEPPELRYGFEKGRDYCYHVTIVGEVSDLTSTYRGVLAHKVVAADDSQFQFSSASELFPDHRNREGRLVVVLPHISPASPPSPSMPMWLGGMPMGRLGAEYTGFSRKGKFIGSQSEQFLPFVLGLQHSLVVEPLPEKSEASWSHEEAEVAVLKRMSGSSIFSHFAKFRAATNISGSETIQYNIVERKENVVRIKKVYSLKTPPDGDMVRFDMSGEGEFEFDVNRGLIQSLKMQYKILVNEKNMTLAIPVSVEYTVFSDAEMAERQQKQDVVATPGGTGKPAVFEPGEREQLIAKLQSGNEADIVAAGHRLAQIAPTAEREDVVRALTVAGSGRSMLAWVGLVRALGVWRTPETEKLLIDALNDQRGMLFGGEILAALAKFRTPDAAKAVAKSMRSVHLRMAVPGALAAMGPVAEEYTIPMLADRDRSVRSEAYKVLGRIGGEKSLDALKQQLTGEREARETREIHAAIEAIHRRGGLPPIMPDADELAANPAIPTGPHNPAIPMGPHSPAGSFGGIGRYASPASDASPASVPGPAKEAVFRKWQDATRSFEVEAKLVSFEGDKVTLLRADGRSVTIPLAKLCEEDQQFVKNHAESRNPFQ